MDNRRYVLGIDMGAKNFGLGVIDDTYTVAYTEMLVIEDDCIVQKSRKLLKALHDITKAYNINLIGYEFSVMKNKTGRTIDILSGVVITHCIQHNIEVRPIAVATCKKKLTGDRHAKKDLVYSSVCSRITNAKNLNKSHHEIDAVAIAICALENT